MEEIKGTIEKINPKGVKIDGRWYNYSKYMQEGTPRVNEGDEVKVDVNGDWIMRFKVLSRQSSETREDRPILSKVEGGSYYSEKEKREVERQVVITRLACLNTATEVLKSHTKPITSKGLFKVAKELEDWVWRGLKEEKKEGEADQGSEEEALTQGFKFGDRNEGGIE